MTFKEITTRSLTENVFDMIEKRWMLVTAGTMADSSGSGLGWNTMTANWAGLGHLWNRDVAFTFVRPTRHTFDFMERHGLYTLSFFDERWREALEYCGKFSGRDHDKAAGTGLRPVEILPGAVSFEQADLILVCSKIHAQDLDPAGFVDPSIHKHYHDDYHRLYVGEILKALRHGKD